MPSRMDHLVAAGLFFSLLFVSRSPGDWRALPGDNPLPPEARASETVRAILDGGGPPPHRPGHQRLVQDGLAVLYAPSAEPVWAPAGRLGVQAATAVRILQDAASEGLVPEDYDAAWLGHGLAALSAAAPAHRSELAAFDVALTVEMLRYLQAVHRGRVRPADVGFAYHVDMQEADFGQRLREALDAGTLDKLATDLEPRFPQYARLKRALAAQRRLSPVPGQPDRVRQLELALERLRWLPHPPEGRFLVANVPAFRLVAFSSPRDPRPSLQMAIVVGKAARTETPAFASELSQVLFRPYWYPPPSILRNEIVPILKRNPGYLARERMELVAATNDASPALPLTPDALERLRTGQLALRQSPGPHNALGLVKFVFPNDYRVYMHDTPARSLFTRKRRDFSHGCIRLERPEQLAAFVLAQQPGWTPERIQAAMKGPRTLRVGVIPPIPVFIFYTTAIVRADESVEFFDDIYGLDTRLDRALTLGR